jgi:hypothetical protein
MFCLLKTKELRGFGYDFPPFSAFFHLNQQTNRQAIGKRDYPRLSPENSLPSR